MQRNLWAGMMGAPMTSGAAQGQGAPAEQISDQPSEESQRLADLRELGDLHAQGVLTEEEFQREKNRLLS